MITESIAIIVISLLISATFLRAKHVGYSVIMLPVIIIPAAYLLAMGAAAISGEMIFNIRSPLFVAFAEVLALAVSCLLIMLLSRKIADSARRKLYIITMVAYSVILGWVYIFNTIKVLF